MENIVELNVNPSEIKYEKYIVACIDMLGVKEALKTDKDILNKIYITYHLFEMLLEKESVRTGIDFKVQYKSFSDNIVICAKFCKNVSKEITQKVFFDAVVLFVATCSAFCGLLLRGGINIGDLYFDDNFVIGEALIKAYKLESELAIYPRIIIDKKSYSELSVGYQAWFKKDIDYYFVDFLNKCNLFENTVLINKENPDSNTGTEKFKKLLLENICKNNSNEKVLQKISWLINYFNNFCDENKYNEMKITDEEISSCLAGEKINA